MAKKRGNPNMRKGAPSVNPLGRGATKMDSMPGLQRADGWYSMLTGVGTAAYDKRLAAEFCADHVPYQTASELMRGNDIAQRAVMIPIEDALRNGFDFTAKSSDDEDLDTKELQEAIEGDWETLDVRAKLTEGMMYEGAYGGAAVLLGVRDGVKDLSIPLDVRRVQSLDFLNVFEPRECIPAYYYADPRQPRYGEPSHYQLAPYAPGTDEKGKASSGETLYVHESRLLVFPGIKVTRDILSHTNGWGDSKFTAMWPVLRDFNASWDGTGILIQDFSQAVIKIKGLAELLSGQQGDQKFADLMQAMQLSRSMVRAVVIDAEDEFGRETTNVTGLHELLKSYMARMSSAAGGIPITKLFGVAPSGLNSSGESDIDQWDDRVKSIQQDKVAPHLKRITELLLKTQKSKAKNWTVVPRALRQQTDKEKAETRNIQAETDKIYVEMQALGADEVRSSRFGGDAYSLETVIDSDVEATSLEEAAAQEIEAAKMEAEALKQANAQGVKPNAKPAPKGGESGK